MIKTKKIVLLASGKSYHATRWANAIKEQGYDITFISIHKVTRPLLNSIKVIIIGNNKKVSYLLYAFKIRRIIQNIKPDIVHSHSAGGYSFLGMVCGIKPWIISVYGSDVYMAPNKSFFHRMMIGIMLSKASLVLSTSKAMANHVKKLYSNVMLPLVTPFGVDTALFKKKTEHMHSGLVIFGIVKKLEKVYGIDILLHAFSIVKNKAQCAVQLHIVGEGSEMHALLALCKSLNINDNVFFHGSLANVKVPKFLESLDIFVVPSREESFGVAAVEASAMSLPVIASNVGGLAEVIIDGETGILVPSENPEALSKAMLRLINDKGLAKRLGIAGRNRVEQEYDWVTNVLRMVSFYEKVIMGEGECNA